VFSLLFEFGLAQEIIAVAKTNEYNHTEAAISFSHTQTSLVWHLLSFCELPPLFARKFVYQFGFLLPASATCKHLGTTLEQETCGKLMPGEGCKEKIKSQVETT